MDTTTTDTTKDMLSPEAIAAAGLADWRKLAQGLHARYDVDGYAAGARLVAAVADAGDEAGHHPRTVVGDGYVDLRLISTDAIYRDDEGNEHVVEWVTQHDVDLARRISEIAAEQGARPNVAGIVEIELAIDTADGDRIGPFWSALLTGGAEALGRGTIGNDVRDLTRRVPNIWFQDTDEHETPRQRFHVDVFLPLELTRPRIEAAVAAGGVIVGDYPSYTVLADPDGNKACVSHPPLEG